MTIVVVAELIFLTATENTSLSALRAGNFLFATALVVVVYGISLYYRRLHLMMTSKPYGYADAIGPAVFAVIIIAGISLIIYWSNDTFNHPNPSLTQKEGVCVQRHQ